MIVEVTVERFRGIRQLRVQDLGRVSLIVGKNDCGKTAFMEAVEIAVSLRAAPTMLMSQQLSRMGSAFGDPANFDRVWSPIFWNHEQETGASIGITRDDGPASKIELRAPPPRGEIVISPHEESTSRGKMRLHAGEELLATKAWTLEFHTSMDGKDETFTLTSSASGLKFPHEPTGKVLWVRPSPVISYVEIQHASIIKPGEREPELLDILRTVDERVSGIELLAPDGKTAELFVRLERGARPLPLTMMGEGFQRCFKISSAIVAGGAPLIFIDGIDNGLHHLAIESLWRWLAAISARRNLQIFATTHSEECIEAACQAFTARNDNGLRVVRLDRHADHTSAAVYDRSLVETAIDASIEIRG